MTQSEKFALYLIIFNAAYFASTEADWLRGLTWFGMTASGIAFIILGKR